LAFLEKPFTAAGLREAVSLLLDGTLRQPAPEETTAARDRRTVLV